MSTVCPRPKPFMPAAHFPALLPGAKQPLTARQDTKALDAKVDDKNSDKSARVARRPPSEPAPLKHEEIRAVIIGIMLAMFLGALDQTIVATALPTIGRHFGDLGDLSWVVTAYLLTGTAVTPLYGKLVRHPRPPRHDAARRSAFSSPARSPARWRRA